MSILVIGATGFIGPAAHQEADRAPASTVVGMDLKPRAPAAFGDCADRRRRWWRRGRHAVRGT